MHAVPRFLNGAGGRWEEGGHEIEERCEEEDGKCEKGGQDKESQERSLNSQS